jgi:hypothetical protein
LLGTTKNEPKIQECLTSVKGKKILGQALRFPGGWGSQISGSQHMKVVRLSALRTGCLYTPENTPDTHFCLRLSRSQGYSATRRIMSMKNSIDSIGNQTHHFPACGTVPQPTAPPHALSYINILLYFLSVVLRKESVPHFIFG